MQIAVALRVSLSSKRILNAAMLVALFTTTQRIAYGQALPTAQKTGDLSVFALYSRLTPDYGPTSNSGLTFGASYLRYTRWWLNPAVEFRAKIANGTTVDEKTIGGGIRLEKQFGKYHPYADFLVSAGSINFHLKNPPILPDGKPYLSDGTVVYAFGGGLDYDLTSKFAFRGDYQYEKWYLDKNPGTPLHLTPNGWSLGVVYRISPRPFSR
ncbi:MAG: hypothetical protein JSS95_15455 [Acidobacteria bacterium]|nr:hypothetical protein [Acidobacteriota bacterium]